MIAHLEIPKLGSGFLVQAIQLALKVLVHAFADIKSAFPEARRGKHVLHPTLAVEFPHNLARSPLQAVNRSRRREAHIVDNANVNALLRHQSRAHDSSTL